MTAAEGASAVAVVGREPTATGNAALDLAKAEARLRRVTVVDLIGETSPLHNVVLTDDVHGVADCFTYGVSFAAVSRATTVDPHVAVIPSGTEPVAYADTLPSTRWERLIEQARDQGALVVFAALLDTPELDSLTARVDHVIPAALVVAPGVPERAEAPIRPGGIGSRYLSSRRLGRVSAPRTRRRQVAATAIVAGVVALVALGWLVTRRSSRSNQETAGGLGAATGARTDTSTAQLATRDGTSGGPANPSGSGVVPVADPADSGVVSAYAMRVGLYPTFAEALRSLRDRAVRLGAATVTPLPDSGVTARPDQHGRIQAHQFAVYAGAARSADALAAAAEEWIRDHGFTGGTYAHTPYALRLADRVTVDSARRATIAWRSRGVPAYSLVDDAGRARVYAGAFETVDQAAPLAASLHTVGVPAVLAYRVGLSP